MVRTMHKMKKERGVALIITLIVLLVLSVLIAALIFVTNTEVWASANYKLLTQARYTAEAGAQATENWLIYTYPAPATFAAFNTTTNPVQVLATGQPVVLSAVPGVNSNYPDPAVVAAYTAAMANQVLPGVPNASFSTYATLISMSPGASVSWLGGAGGGVMQTWQITSQGSIGGVRNAKVQVVQTIQRGGSPIFNYGLEATGTGCGTMIFDKNDNTDSYNSALGVYGGANTGNQGNVATNGNVTLAKGSNINGTIAAQNTTVGACATSGLTDAGAGNYLSLSAVNPKLNPPLPWGCTMQPCYPPGTLVTTAQNVSTGCASIPGCTSSGLGVDGTAPPVSSVSIQDGGGTKTANDFTLAPGSYGNITIDAADVVHVSAGTYNINSINFAQNGQFVVDSGPVVFNIVGNCASGCPTEGGGKGGGGGNGLPASYSTTEVIYGAGYAGFNGCSGGVTANPNVYGSTTCGSAKSAYSGIPNNLQVVYGGTDTIRLGGMPNALVLYAPNAGYYTPGAPVGLYGSAIVKFFDDESGSWFHYDTQLTGAITQVGPYHMVGYSWSKF